MNIDSRDLEVFYWVAQLGSFRRAAEQLSTTQPAISHRVARLEVNLGVKLLNRGPRAATLTSKGRELHNHAERVVGIMAEIAQTVAVPTALDGVVRVGVSETIVHTWLARFIERVHSSFPNLTLDVEVDVSAHLRDALVEKRLDVGFLLGPISEPSMINHDLCHYPLAFVANASMDLGPEPVSLLTLAGTPLITYPKTTRPYLALRQLLTRAGLPMPRIYSNSSLSTIVSMTLDGIGVSVIPPVIIGPQLTRGELRILKTEVELPDLVFTAAMPSAPGGSLADSLIGLAKQVVSEHKD
jgi:DNA-binding transcriptional LysR family regulator